MRTCRSCGETKSEGEFYGRTGRVSYECKVCHSGLGNLGDSVDRLLAAARYLLEYSETATRAAGEPLAGDPRDLLNREVI